MTESGSERRAIALLGRRDEPTDAVEEYCRYLSSALRARGIDLQVERVNWAESGWPAALAELEKRAAHWCGCWIFVQYTALAWSHRGFPGRFINILRLLRRAGARLGIVYHDVLPYTGGRIVDRARRLAQLRTMRTALHIADRGLFTVSPDRVPWIPVRSANIVFIPVGPNLPLEVLDSAGNSTSNSPASQCKTVAVFGITGGDAGRNETTRIAAVMRFAADRAGALQLHAFGRHANDHAAQLRAELQGSAVQVRVDDVLPGEDVIRHLRAAQVLLFVRGAISSRRGSAIAGIACGLPVIAYDGPETAAPVTDAGVVLVSPHNLGQLGEALVHVLNDDGYRAGLAARSRAAYARDFAWTNIARRYSDVIQSSS